MRHIRWRKSPRIRVTAIFRTDSAFFDLPPAATFGDLADRVAHLSQRKHDALVGLNVMLAAKRSEASTRNAGTSKAGAR